MIEWAMPLARRLFALLVLAMLPSAAFAQEPAPPGQFDYYLFTLSWSPAYCLAHRDDPRARAECSRHRGFIVHGLWPQNEDGSWPDFCQAVPPVPPAVVARETEIMPNAGLVRHEWERHGSCTGLSAEAYFGALDRAFAQLHIPEALVQPTAPLSLPLADAKSLFVAANPGLAANMISMRCTHDGAIEELRLCLDKSLRFRTCGRGSEDSCPSGMHFDPILGAGQ
jgi:ribonuclease T2